ncbi:hypothetical protein TRFO_13592 [Tritrichomonas foetus]|uniref:Autophagy-related protein 13 N-terminal domain-containing protein n=1 Tax=Tritrichomonas foetus TaxID=1144522 RepID=A0A1J4KXF3_9EUKA|nr:hypothetical protein TRFO_13592 [Tritrichomonas foetus]|eukprot:OHT15931.1 hypothetical protein TRFO_13592 [Tritrichomonas foetus]
MSSSSQISIHLSLSESEQRKYLDITKAFLCKAMECIYVNRCPNELSDLTSDDQKLFTINVPKSESLRRFLISSHNFGWFRILVKLTNPEVILERWTFIHATIRESDKIPKSKDDVYRHFSRVLRSIYSMLNALPTKSLEIILSNFPACNRRITAECFHFSKDPISFPVFSENPSIDKQRFGPVITPVGKIMIACETVTDITIYIPRLISKPPRRQSEADIMKLPYSPSKNSFSMEFSYTSPVNSPSFCGELVSSGTLTQFFEKIEMMPRKIPHEFEQNIENVIERFDLAKHEYLQFIQQNC